VNTANGREAVRVFTLRQLLELKAAVAVLVVSFDAETAEGLALCQALAS